MIRISLLGSLVATVMISCTKVPISGRKQARLIPVQSLNQASFQQYGQFLQQNPPVPSGNATAQVKNVGTKIVAAARRYYRAQGESEKFLSEFQWEFNVVNDPLVNAFCMPGGKVVVYTGILPIAQDDDGLAVIMGHEIAHALAHHGNERMTQMYGVQGGLVLADAYMQVRTAQSETQQQAQNREMFRQGVMAAAGLGAQVGIILPFSRLHESEADKIGLYLMALAGYDVDAAAPFWERMQAQAGGSAPPEFLSTHPHPATRVANLQEWAAEAKQFAATFQD